MIRMARLFLVLALAAVVTGCAPVVGDSGKITITAYFVDSAGLFEGNDVGILGVPVGTVTKIEPVGTRAKATLEVDGSHDVPADAQAVVVARSVATDRYVELTPVYREGPTIESGAVIDTDRTATPVDFDEVLEAINTFATGIGGNKQSRRAVRRIIDEGADALNGNGELFNQTVTRMAGAANGLSAQRKDIAASLVSLDALVAEIAANEGTAREFIQQVSRASRLLAEERENFRTALRSIDRAVTTIAEFTKNNREEFLGSLGNINTTMRIMLGKRRELTEILEVMPLTLQNLRRIKKPDNRLQVRAPEDSLLPLAGAVLELCQEDLVGTICELVADGGAP